MSFRVLASDRIAAWLVGPNDLLWDSRAEHLWDEERVIGRWYENGVTRLGNPGEDRVEWDAYFLYSPDAAWGEEPPALVSWGRTIVDSRNQLLLDFNTLLAEGDSGREN